MLENETICKHFMSIIKKPLSRLDPKVKAQLIKMKILQEKRKLREERIESQAMLMKNKIDIIVQRFWVDNKKPRFSSKKSFLKMQDILNDCVESYQHSQEWRASLTSHKRAIKSLTSAMKKIEKKFRSLASQLKVLEDLSAFRSITKTDRALSAKRKFAGSNFSELLDNLLMGDRHLKAYPVLYNFLVLFVAGILTKMKFFSKSKFMLSKLLRYNMIREGLYPGVCKPTGDASATRFVEFQIVCFMEIGEIFIQVCEMKRAMKYFKRALELSFYLKNENLELKTYDKFGIIFFYLNDLQKAKYFHDRMMRRLVEPDHSPLKISMLKKFEDRRKKYKNLLMVCRLKLKKELFAERADSPSHHQEQKIVEKHQNEGDEWHGGPEEKSQKLAQDDSITLQRGSGGVDGNNASQTYRKQRIHKNFNTSSQGEIIRVSEYQKREHHLNQEDRMPNNAFKKNRKKFGGSQLLHTNTSPNKRFTQLNKGFKYYEEMLNFSSDDEEEMQVSLVVGNKIKATVEVHEMPKYFMLKKRYAGPLTISSDKRRRPISEIWTRTKKNLQTENQAFDKVFRGEECRARHLQHMSGNRSDVVFQYNQRGEVSRVSASNTRAEYSSVVDKTASAGNFYAERSVKRVHKFNSFSGAGIAKRGGDFSQIESRRTARKRFRPQTSKVNGERRLKGGQGPRKAGRIKQDNLLGNAPIVAISGSGGIGGGDSSRHAGGVDLGEDFPVDQTFLSKPSIINFSGGGGGSKDDLDDDDPDDVAQITKDRDHLNKILGETGKSVSSKKSFRGGVERRQNNLGQQHPPPQNSISIDEDPSSPFMRKKTTNSRSSKKTQRKNINKRNGNIGSHRRNNNYSFPRNPFNVINSKKNKKITPRVYSRHHPRHRRPKIQRPFSSANRSNASSCNSSQNRQFRPNHTNAMSENNIMLPANNQRRPPHAVDLKSLEKALKFKSNHKKNTKVFINQQVKNCLEVIEMAHSGASKLIKKFISVQNLQRKKRGGGLVKRYKLKHSITMSASPYTKLNNLAISSGTFQKNNSKSKISQNLGDMAGLDEIELNSSKDHSLRFHEQVRRKNDFMKLVKKRVKKVTVSQNHSPLLAKTKKIKPFESFHSSHKRSQMLKLRKSEKAAEKSSVRSRASGKAFLVGGGSFRRSVDRVSHNTSSNQMREQKYGRSRSIKTGMLRGRIRSAITKVKIRTGSFAGEVKKGGESVGDGGEGTGTESLFTKVNLIQDYDY